MLISFIVITFLSGLFTEISWAVNSTPTTGTTNVMPGGIFYYPISSEPEKLHPINSSDLYARYVQQYAIEGLLNTNPNTYELEPGLAEKWETGKDGVYYIFHLRKGVKFQNGEEVTADLVKWNFEARMDDAFKAFNLRPYLENVEKVEVLDKYKVKFHIKKKYFGNLDAIGSYSILGIVPKSVYGDPNDKKANKILVGTGPYKLDKYEKGSYITLKKNPDWWGWKEPNLPESLKAANNFDTIHFKFVKEQNVRIEMLKKGQLDYDELTPEQYIKKTEGKPWGEKVFKKAVENDEPKSYGFVGWNFKNPIFQDKNVRVALAHLMNRPLMNEKFRFNRSYMGTGPWYLQSPYADKDVKPFDFNPEKAKQLLTKAGWQDSDKDGVLDKVIDGKKTSFTFSLMYANRDSEKYYTMYKEDLKKAGIIADLKVLEWNSFVKALDEQKFDAVSLGWGGGSVHNDPKQIWHTESAKMGGSNFISYSNKEVDKLIDQGREIIDNEKRKVLWKKVYKIIAEDAAYAYMFVDKFEHYAVSSRIGQPKETFKYDVGKAYWWVK